MMLGVLEGSARKRFKRGLCRHAAEGGHHAVLQWARAKSYPFTWMDREHVAINPKALERGSSGEASAV